MKQISLFISLIGILILLIIINIQEPKISQINSLSIAQLNKKVAIQGKIIDLKIIKENNFTIAKVKDNSGYMEIICNCPQLKNYRNNTLIINGRLTEYKNNLQMQSDKIKLIR